MKKYLLLILLLFSGCKFITGASLSPFAFLGIPDPDGTPIFKKGFKNGCEAIISNRGTELFRHRYPYQFDVDLIDNPEYQFGFARGWSNCFNAIVSGRHTLGGSADTYLYNSMFGGGAAPGQGAGMDMGVGTIEHTIADGGNVWSNPFSVGGGIDGAIWGPVQTGKGGAGTAFGAHPLWGTWQTGQIFGQ